PVFGKGKVEAAADTATRLQTAIQARETLIPVLGGYEVPWFGGLLALVRFRLNADPLSGHLFFRSRSADRLKVLYGGGHGLCLWRPLRCFIWHGRVHPEL